MASRYEIEDYINKFGCDRIMFGSDFPFGYPKEELSKILNLPIPQKKKEMILTQNLKRLVENSNVADQGRKKAESRIM